MDENHKELLKIHQDKFLASIEVDRLFPILQDAGVLDSDDISLIKSATSRSSQVEKLLNILPEKTSYSFQTLCLALEPTYPHLLTVMFLGSNNTVSTPDSRSLSLASSEEDILNQSSTTDTRSLDGPKTYTRIIPSHEYDLPETYPSLTKDSKSSKSGKHKHRMEINSRSGMNEDRTSLDRQREYDRLKTECENAMAEVQSLKRQQEETVKRYNHALKDTDSYQQKYKSVLLQLQHARDEIDNWKSQCEDLRSFQNVSGNDSSGSDIFENQAERYANILGKFKESESKVRLLVEDNMKLRKQFESVSLEKESAYAERNGLKQQCTAAIRDLAKVTQQRDDMIKENHKVNSEYLSKVSKLHKECEEAKQDQYLVLSERDNVLKEINQLQDEVNDSRQKIETMEKEKKFSLEEIDKLKLEMSQIKKEREQLFKDRNDIYDKYGDLISKKDQIENQRNEYRKDFQLAKQERDMAIKESQEAIMEKERILRETYERERSRKEEAEDRDHDSKETEKLKKLIEKLQNDLHDALGEVEKYKKSRDWALSCREKSLQECDSIRTLGENLRRQRDRADNEKAQALRDYDNLKKQKDEAVRELKEIREKYEAMVEKEARKSQLNGVGHNHSRDSAIDADLQEWETETHEIEIGGLNPENLGFDLCGGKEDPQCPSDNSILVSYVKPSSPADGKLRVNDVIVQINNIDVTNFDKRSALQVLRNSSSSVASFLVRRRRCITPRTWQPLQLSVMLGKDLGLHIEQGLYISRITPGSIVAKEGILTTGDRIVCVNGRSVENLTPKELIKVLEDCKDPVSLDIWRQTTFNSAASSPTPITQTTISPKTEQMSYSKPETISMKKNAWEPNSSPDNNKNLKSSESQTDTIKKSDSKFLNGSNRHKENDHKQGLLKKFFGGNTRMGKNHDKPHNLEESSHVSPMTTSHISSQQTTDDDFWKDLGLHTGLVDKKNDYFQKSSRKREYEVENNGTWPKCNRIIPPQVNGTVMVPSPRKKQERPSILTSNLDGTQKVPPDPPERTISSYEAVRHSPQSSDSTVKYHHSPQSSDSTVRRYPSYSPVSSPKPRMKSSPFVQNSAMTTSMPPYSSYIHENSYLPRKTVSPNRNSYVSQKAYPLKNRHHDVPSTYSRDIIREPGGNNKPQRRRPVERDNKERRHHYSGPHSRSSHPFNTSTDSQSSRMSTSSPRWSSETSTFDSLHSPPYLTERVPSTSSFPSSRGSHYGSTGMSPVGPKPFPMPHTDQEFRRPSPSFPEWCSSPSPSQISSTPSDHMLYSSHQGPRKSAEYETSTFPRKVPQSNWMWIPPSNQSIASTGSVEVVSARSSPGSPMFESENIVDPEHARRRLHPGQTRTIYIERTSQPVGFQIETGPKGGTFVSSVNENSLAAKAGLVIGDQFLEICGINMRTASQEMASQILKQVGNSLSLLVQHNPDEYYSKTGDSSGEDSANNSPKNSPGLGTFKRNHNGTGSSGRNKTPRASIVDASDTACEAARVLSFKKSSPNLSLGISTIGGNAVGIFVHEVQPQSFAFGHDGLHCCDQILEYNGVDFRKLTAEEASLELTKPCPSVRMLVQYNPARYKKVYNQPGDHFYVRVHFDHTAENHGELSFKKNDILLVESTIHDGKLGHWFAWLVDDEGRKTQKCGTIPSKERLEDDFNLKRSQSENEFEDLKGSRRGSGNVRRSFLQRRKHKRNNSKDSREFNSFSDASLNSDSVPQLDDISVYTYTKIERMECKKIRPVILLAPLSDPLIKKLVSESPDIYLACQPAVMQASVQVMEQGLADGTYIDYWQEDDHFVCIRVTSIHEISDKGMHSLLNGSPSSIERLHRQHIYPIVIFARHKSVKQLRELRDPQFLPERLNAKAAKDIFEKFQKFEKDYNHQFSAVIQGGNIAEMHQQIKTVISSEQKKGIWVPSVL